MSEPRRGEVWLPDLGLAAKVRPCLVVSVPASDTERALATVIPHTTALRGTKFECTVAVAFLKSGAFDAQGLVSVPHAKLLRPLGVLREGQLNQVEGVLRLWLGLET